MTLEEYCKEKGHTFGPGPREILKHLEADITDWRSQLNEPHIWSVIDQYVWSGFAEFALGQCGVTLVERWIGCSNRVLRDAADSWLLCEWQVVWDALGDVAKRRVAEVQHERLLQARARSSVLNDLIRAFRRR